MTGFRLCYRSCLGARMTQISLKQPDRRAALQRLQPVMLASRLTNIGDIAAVRKVR